jgi:hypothetical protein
MMRRPKNISRVLREKKKKREREREILRLIAQSEMLKFYLYFEACVQSILVNRLTLAGRVSQMVRVESNLLC